MNKKGKRLREFEKNNRNLTVRSADERKAQKKSPEEVVEVPGSVKKQAKKKKKIVLNIRRLTISTIAVVFIVFVGVSMLKVVKLQKEYDELLKRQEELEQLKAKLTSELEYVDSAEYIEQQARKSLRLVMDNEILFILSDEYNVNEEK